MGDVLINDIANQTSEVIVQAGKDQLGGNLTIPAGSMTIVLFVVHGEFVVNHTLASSSPNTCAWRIRSLP